MREITSVDELVELVGESVRRVAEKVRPARPAIAKTLERPEDPMSELEHYYGPAYAAKLY